MPKHTNSLNFSLLINAKSRHDSHPIITILLFPIYHIHTLTLKSGQESIHIYNLSMTNWRQTQPKQYKQDCKEAWNCPHLLKQKCKMLHDPDDEANALSLRSLLKRHQKEIVLILDQLFNKTENKPVCLFQPLLPIHLLKNDDLPMDAGNYYIGIFIEVSNRKAVIKFDRPLGSFGTWIAESKIFDNFGQLQYKLRDRGQNRTFRGQIKIVDSKSKILIGNQGHRWHLQCINNFQKFPVLKQTKVEYFEQNRHPQITKIMHPKEIRLSGMVQIDKNSQFYFIPRNMDYDDMNLFSVPKDLEITLKQFQFLFPYSVFKKQTLEKKEVNKINDILERLLLKGYFKEWPLRSRYPFIELIEEEVEERNLHNLKSAIIFESGISLRKFSAQQKTQSDKISKKFSIQNYSSRPLLKNVFTIDNKRTKCYDDAIYIEPLPEGGFVVQLHIADAAQLIKSNSALNRQIKLRDQTVYIKNNHQPMIPEALKNLLSLKADQDKITFTLKLEITPKGFVDFRTVDFFRSRIRVEENLAHETLAEKPQIFPQLFKLDELINSSNLIDSNYILECQSKSEIAMARLIILSSILPTFMLEENIKRSTQLKEQLNEKVRQIIDNKSAQMQKWEEEVTKINALKKDELKVKKQLNNLDNLIKKEINKARKQKKDELKKQLDQNKEKKEKKQKEKKPKKEKIGEQQSIEEIESEDQDQQPQISQMDIISQHEAEEKIDIEEINDQLEQKLKEKRAKVIQEARLKQISSESESEQESQESSSDSDFEDEDAKMNRAVGGKAYLSRQFSYFNINLKWASIKQINEAFNLILSKDKGKLYQQFFKRMQIMNRQHFKYIVRMTEQSRKEKQKKQERGDKKDRNYQRLEQPKKEEIKKQEETIIQPKVEMLEVQPMNLVKKAKYKLVQKTKPQQVKKEQKSSQFMDEVFTKPEKNQVSAKVEEDVMSIKQKIEKTSIQQKKEKPGRRKRTLNDKNQRQKANEPPIGEIDKQKQIKKNKRELKQQNNEKVKYEQKQIIKFNDTQKQQKNNILQKVRTKCDYYLQKYQQLFERGEKIQVSEDEFFQNQENLEVKQSLYIVKKNAIIQAIRTELKHSKGKKPKKEIKQKYIQQHSNKKIPKRAVKQEMDYLIKQYLLEKSPKKIKTKEINKVKKNQFNNRKQQISQEIIAPQHIELVGVLSQNQKIIPETKIEEISQIKQQKNTIQVQHQSVNKSLPNKKSAKKELQAKIEEEIRKLSEEIKEKYAQQKRSLVDKLDEAQKMVKQVSKSLLDGLKQAEKQYNLILMLSDVKDTQETQEKEKKGKKGKREVSKQKKKGMFSDFLDNFQVFAKKANFKFKKMEADQIDAFLLKEFEVKDICSQQNIQNMNKAASKTGQDEDSLLKWNNPIRSYQSLQVMRIIKKYDWLFQGSLHPTDIALYYDDIKQVRKQLKQLAKYRQAKLERGQTNKKAKEANRQIAKVQFWNLTKRNPERIETFLTITSRPGAEYRSVYHPILQQIKVEKNAKVNKNYQFFKEVQGKVHIKREFPLEFLVELI